MRCLSCEIHVIYRVVLQFSREAIIAQRHLSVLEKFKDTHSAYINFETPELKPRSMKGGVATIIIDRLLPDQKKRTIQAFADGFKKEINADDLDEGFIEIHSLEDRIELIDWEEYKPIVCKTKKRRENGKKVDS